MFLPATFDEAKWPLLGLVILVLCLTVWNPRLVRKLRKLVERRSP